MRNNSIQVRFWDRCVKSGNCLLWIGAKCNGYGIIRYKRKHWRTHRLCWYLTNGKIPDGLCVLHRCDDPSCVNIQHLFLGTHKDNTQDMLTKGRHKAEKGEDHHGSVLTNAQVLNARKLYKTGKYTFAKIARMMEVSSGTIRFSISGNTWKHLDSSNINTDRDRQVKGADHPDAKLTLLEVKLIRRRYARGLNTYSELGVQFGVTKSCIQHVISRRTWKHIP